MRAHPACRRWSTVELFKTRIAPATLNLLGGVLIYTGSGVIDNVLTLNVSGANYTFADWAIGWSPTP